MNLKKKLNTLKKVGCMILAVITCVLSTCSCTQTVVVHLPKTTGPAVSLPDDKPTDPLTLTFCDTPLNKELIIPNESSSYEIVKDRVNGYVLKLTPVAGKSTEPSIRIDYKKYMELSGLDPVKLGDCKYAVCYIKLEKTQNARMEITLSGENENGEAEIVNGEAVHQKDAYVWQYVKVPLAYEDSAHVLDEINVSFLRAPQAGETLYVQSITFFENEIDALELMELDPYGLIDSKTHEIYVEGLSKEYTFMHLTDTHACALSLADKSIMSPSRYSYVSNMRNTYRINGILTEDKLSSYFQYAYDNDADLMMLTGDIITFPSEGNIRLLDRVMKTSKVKTLFSVGNHDWTFSDDYQSANAASTFFPKLEQAIGADPHFSYVEFDDVIVVAIDNSTNKVTKETVDKFFALYEKEKPIILTLHVPLYSKNLYDYGINKEGVSYTMGGKSLFADDPNVKRLYEAVCVAEDTPVIAVFSGHLHIDFEESFPNGVPQYVTYPGFDGGCRMIKLKPKV